MRVSEIMASDPICCTPDTGLQEVAKIMTDKDCGCLPVVSDKEGMEPIGTITDRDICCRAVALGKNPLEMTADDCMSSPVITVARDADIEECCRLMEENQVRRLPVVDENGACCGMIAQADIARVAPDQMAGDLVKEVSRATSGSSNA